MKDLIPEPDDFADLDDLLGQATQLQSIKQAGRDASSKLRRGNMRDDDREDALASVRAAEAIFVWETVTECAIVQESHCLTCNSVSSQFIGYYLLRRHLHDKGSKQVLRIEAPSTSPLPRYTATSFTVACPACLKDEALPSALVEEFALLRKFNDGGN